MTCRWLPILMYIPVAMGVQAAPTDTAIHHTPLVATQSELPVEQGRRWGLSAQEWTEYEQVMRNRRGVWSPGLDPITALGVSADTAAERNRYAELYVRTEFERTRKELAFQLAVDRAWARLYPDTPRLQTRAIPQAANGPTVRYALIVSTECTACEATIAQRLSRMLEQAQDGIDIHVVGTGDDDQVLRDWIKHQPDILAGLKAGRVTVNHGHPFADLAAFPAIYAKAESGQWSREL
jgi:integrating conjugative element protein (TIGR03759 family)